MCEERYRVSTNKKDCTYVRSINYKAHYIDWSSHIFGHISFKGDTFDTPIAGSKRRIQERG